MTEIAHPIDLNLPAKLQDKDYRQQFFLAESSARIAEQIIALRKRRGLNQKQLAELVDTQQPAISRVEQADYQNWSFSSLRKIVGALDARIRVLIQPSEDVLSEYDDDQSDDQPDLYEEILEAVEDAASTKSWGYLVAPNSVASNMVGMTDYSLGRHRGWLGHCIGFQNFSIFTHQQPCVPPFRTDQLAKQLEEKDAEIERLRKENEALKSLVVVLPSPQNVQVRITTSSEQGRWLPISNLVAQQ